MSTSKDWLKAHVVRRAKYFVTTLKA
jgi:hypothetical protein